MHTLQFSQHRGRVRVVGLPDDSHTITMLARVMCIISVHFVMMIVAWHTIVVTIDYDYDYEIILFRHKQVNKETYNFIPEINNIMML